jgi:hypothetical protein
MAWLMPILMSALGTFLASLFGAGLFGLFPAEDTDAPPAAQVVSVQEGGSDSDELVGD